MRNPVITTILLIAACSSGDASGPAESSRSAVARPAAAAPTPPPTPPPPAAKPAVAAAPAPAAAGTGRPAGDDVNPRLLRRFKPLRASFHDGAPSAALVDLGRMLFFDERLSRDSDLSCNSCHALDQYGVDHEATSTGVDGQRGKRNAPTVYHAAGAFTSFWDGRAANVEEQATGPILNPAEMGMASPAEMIARLAAVPGYVDAFAAAFPGRGPAITAEHVGAAIGAFERGLVTPSRWDAYLTGDRTALTSEEIAGLKIFTDIGCMTCHTGELVGGSMFQKVGAVNPWPNQTDRGRASVTKVKADEMQFKVPSLRNIAKTAPYFHDASATTLEEAVRMMANYQLGEDLTDEDVAAIVAWLGALTGDLPTAYIARPTLP
jgi:cytochrome c peroxidase